MHVCFLGDAHRVRLYLPYRPQIPPFITNATDQTCKNSHRAVSSLLQTGKAKKRRNCPNAEKKHATKPQYPAYTQTLPDNATASNRNSAEPLPKGIHTKIKNRETPIKTCRSIADICTNTRPHYHTPNYSILRSPLHSTFHNRTQ